MLDPRRTESDVRPEKVEDLKNGYWFYNYDIKLCEDQPTSEMNPTIGERYEFIQVRVDGEPDYKKCVELVIRQYITQSQEFDLINSYNRAAFNMLSDTEAEKAGNEYLEYLQKVSEIKANVRKDFE